MWRDFRFGARTLRRSPAFTVAAILMLALGIGANTAMSSLIDAILLRPFPLPHPEQLAPVYGFDRKTAASFLDRIPITRTSAASPYDRSATDQLRASLAGAGFVARPLESLAEVCARAMGITCLELRPCWSAGRLDCRQSSCRY